MASPSAVVFPVRAIAVLCRQRGIPCLVDGAHAPGLLDLDVDAIGADWYVGNCHKWLCGPKSAAFVAVADRPVAAVHPLVISHAYGQGFTAEFDKVGTHDPTAVLSLPAAIAFHQMLGGARLRQRNRDLAVAAAQEVAAALGTELGAAPGLFQAMATVGLPRHLPATREVAAGLHDHLYDAHRIESAITMVAGRLFLRISAQAYNSEADYAGLGAAVREAVGAAAGVAA